ncbi:WD40 repeat domain-containing protein [Paenibacillaceae bacterium]|nr:WD40 repeat domain-containing protein [Paenibacillaceae bacterium]
MNRVELVKMPDLSNIPTAAGQKIVVSPDGEYVILVHTNAPYLTIYRFNNGTLTRLSNPATMPRGQTRNVSFSKDNNFMVVAHNESPFISIYTVSDGTFTKLPNPTNLPENGGRTVVFSPDELHMIVGCYSTGTPSLYLYNISGNTFTRQTDQFGFFGSVDAMDLSHDGMYLAVYAWLNNAGSIHYFKRVGDSYIKQSQISVSNIISIKFSVDSSFLLTTHASQTPFINIYDVSGDTLIKRSDTEELMSDPCYSISFSVSGQHIAITHRDSPNVSLFSYSKGKLIKSGSPDSPPIFARGVDFSLDEKYVLTTTSDSPFIAIYEIIVFRNRLLVKCEGNYLSYKDEQWQIVSQSEPNEALYLSGGMDDISHIPDSAWAELTGEVEFCYYVGEDDVSEVSFNIETEPFTLEQEWEGKEIKVLEYTDDPTYNESTVTLETEPFSLYDELGDEVDVLYYTDDPNVTSPELEIDANYTPLDEIDGDFDVVTYRVDDDKPDEIDLNMDALPIGQLVVSLEDFRLRGELKSIISEAKAGGIIRFFFSFDEGSTWEIFRHNKWKVLSPSDKNMLKRYGMRLNEFNSLPIDKLQDKISTFSQDNNKFRVAYYIEERSQHEETSVDFVKAIAEAPLNDVKYEDMAFYLLNTVATINVSFSGNKLSGSVEDEDKGKVRYRVLLNNQPYVPADGSFTQYTPSPIDINIVIDDRRLLFGRENTLTVEFEDTWGATDSWQTTFIGTYSGLMFMDESNQYYSDTFGGILKHLDFGQIIAGQTTLDQMVYVKNLLGYDVENFTLEAIQPKVKDDESGEFKDADGIKVELSKTQSPFLASSILHYDQIFIADDRVEFYVRITTLKTAKPIPNGKFEVRIKADKVS